MSDDIEILEEVLQGQVGPEEESTKVDSFADFDYEIEKEEIKIDPKVRLNIQQLLVSENLIPNGKMDWEITDSWLEFGTHGRVFLVLINARKEVEVDPDYRFIRGLVIDLQKMKIYARTNGYIPSFSSSEVLVRDEKILYTEGEGNFFLSDSLGNVVKKDLVTFGIAHDGVIVRTLLVPDENGKKGRVLLATNKTFQPVESRWDQSRSFTEIFFSYPFARQMLENLYDLSKMHSSVSHSFVLSDPTLWFASLARTGSPQNLGPGYIVYLGETHFYEQSNSPYVDADETVRFPSDALSVLIDRNTSPYLYWPKESLTLDQVNDLLKYGFENSNPNFDRTCLEDVDPRLHPGGAVICYIRSEKNPNIFDRIVRLASPAHLFRESLRPSANLKLSFLRMRDYALEKSGKKFEDAFPLVERKPLSEIDEHIKNWKYLCLRNVTPKNLDFYRRMEMLFAIYMSSVPYHRRAEIYYISLRLKTEISDLINWVLLFKGLTEKEIREIFNVSWNDDKGNLISASDRFEKHIDLLVNLATRIQVDLPSPFQRSFVQKAIHNMSGSILYRFLVLHEKTKDRIQIPQVFVKSKQVRSGDVAEKKNYEGKGSSRPTKTTQTRSGEDSPRPAKTTQTRSGEDSPRPAKTKQTRFGNSSRRMVYEEEEDNSRPKTKTKKTSRPGMKKFSEE